MDELTPEEELAALTALDNQPIGQTIKQMMAFSLAVTYDPLRDTGDSGLVCTFAQCMHAMLRTWVGEDPKALEGAAKALVVMMVAVGATSAGVVGSSNHGPVTPRDVDNILCAVMATTAPIFDLIPLRDLP